VEKINCDRKQQQKMDDFCAIGGNNQDEMVVPVTLVRILECSRQCVAGMLYRLRLLVRPELENKIRQKPLDVHILTVFFFEAYVVALVW
jgi:hypothetical protein